MCEYMAFKDYLTLFLASELAFHLLIRVVGLWGWLCILNHYDKNNGQNPVREKSRNRIASDEWGM